MRKLQKDQKGFTIIDVLIVLAIAGLIMLIVFIAVPQLQRNQRNSARSNDANLIVSAISECMTNRNGVVASCDSVGGNEVTLPGNLNQLVTTTYGAGAGSTIAATWVFAVQCNADGTNTVGCTA